MYTAGIQVVSYQITKMCFICIAICDNNYICHCNITFGLCVYMWLFSLSGSNWNPRTNTSISISIERDPSILFFLSYYMIWCTTFSVDTLLYTACLYVSLQYENRNEKSLCQLKNHKTNRTECSLYMYISISIYNV